jgi:hypothetical protein
MVRPSGLDGAHDQIDAVAVPDPTLLKVELRRKSLPSSTTPSIATDSCTYMVTESELERRFR